MNQASNLNQVAPIPMGARLIIERPDEPRPPSNAPEPARPYFYAGNMAGLSGDRVMVDVPGLGVHDFSRDDGRWLAGPCLNLEDCRIYGPSFAEHLAPKAALTARDWPIQTSGVLR